MAVDSKEVKTVEIPEDSETQAEERSSRVTPKWFKRITRNGDMYERSTDVTEEIRKEDGESDVTRSIMNKYNKQFAPKRQVRTSEPETEEATINGQKTRIPKATRRQKQMFISNRGNEYYAWRRQQQEAYNRARKNAK